MLSASLEGLACQLNIDIDLRLLASIEDEARGDTDRTVLIYAELFLARRLLELAADLSHTERPLPPPARPPRGRPAFGRRPITTRCAPLRATLPGLSSPSYNSVYAHTTRVGGSVMERNADGSEKRQAEGSGVVEYRPYEDGMLQAEVRIYTRRDGGRSERGPYWYFRYHEGGKQKKLYLGKTDDPEAALALKRAQRPAS